MLPYVSLQEIVAVATTIVIAQLTLSINVYWCHLALPLQFPISSYQNVCVCLHGEIPPITKLFTKL